MKSILYLFLFNLSFTTVGQTDFTSTSGKDIFIQSVAKIELVKIEPFCTRQRRYIDSLGRKKTVEICHAESVLECLQIGDSLTCDINPTRLTKNTEISGDDFQLIFRILFASESIDYITACYMPRHGIFFYNANDEQIGFVEICFECDRSLSTPEVPDIGLLPHKAFVELRTLFDKYGF